MKVIFKKKKHYMCIFNPKADCYFQDKPNSTQCFECIQTQFLITSIFSNSLQAMNLIDPMKKMKGYI